MSGPGDHYRVKGKDYLLGVERFRDHQRGTWSQGYRFTVNTYIMGLFHKLSQVNFSITVRGVFGTQVGSLRTL